MNAKTQTILLVLGGIAVLSIGVWRTMTAPPLAHILVGVDRSRSVEPNCAGLRSAAEALLDRPGVGVGSTFTLLSMGAHARAPEPQLLLSASIPIPSDRVVGQSAQAKAYEQERSAFLAGLASRCESIEETTHTPLYQMVERGLTHLRGLQEGCPPGASCVLLIKSDLLEDVQPELRAALDAATKDTDTPVPSALAGRLQNDGIDVIFCGTAEVRAPAKGTIAPPIAVRERIWRALFSRPEAVSFQPFCVGPTG